MANYHVYILTNKRKTVLYIGVCNNLKRRLYEHQQGKLLNAFSKRYGCQFLIYYERFEDINQAIGREKELKKWRRDKKEALIEKTNPNWDFLNDEV
ncbi:GIY-YIG nuclease family protein [Luteibaculum oceani]|uniref:GIY-YIG nuclease family protein n=1 Tax=Luteibaculum oceani TaxID=1294296 RepID=A0A5C6VAM6_9FLAO|nr:GIY-YIG nuclease family protein [Luteibaculum oceani]TXC81386.1 GIY-YIG nuclease family protein [Luteibaculum oceani]